MKPQFCVRMNTGRWIVEIQRTGRVTLAFDFYLKTIVTQLSKISDILIHVPAVVVFNDDTGRSFRFNTLV